MKHSFECKDCEDGPCVLSHRGKEEPDDICLWLSDGGQLQTGYWAEVKGRRSGRKKPKE